MISLCLSCFVISVIDSFRITLQMFFLSFDDHGFGILTIFEFYMVFIDDSWPYIYDKVEKVGKLHLA